MRLNLLIIPAFISLIFFGCGGEKTPDAVITGLINDTSIRFAKRFAVALHKDFKIVYLFGNRNNRDTTAAFILYKQIPPAEHTRFRAIKVPCRKIAALSSIYAAMFSELGSLPDIAAIDNVDYINDTAVIQKFKDGGLKELARTPEINAEQTIMLNPDMLFCFGMGDNDGEKNRKLQQTGIPVAVCVDHLEEHPLARAEWIKFFALFVNKENVADSIFNEVELHYNRLRKLVSEHNAHKNIRPTVFSETKFGDVWYMPGGKSFAATLMNDAGGNYLWNDNSDFGSLPLSFEQVFQKARDADYWINFPLVNSRRELLSTESRYGEFKAFKNGNLYNNTKHTNSFGYSIYWETGMIHPERILSDMVQIFHPELKKVIKNDLYYYHQLK